MKLPSYVVALIACSAFVAALEAIAPARPSQKQLRPRLWSDVLQLAFNGHFLGAWIYAISTRFVIPPLDAFLSRANLSGLVYRNVATGWPLWLQIVTVIVVMDFVQWCVHNLLHRVPWLWTFHEAHHSVVDGEMDWIVSFRFHWMEVVVYKSMQYLPLAFFGFSGTAIYAHAVFGTLIGHLNHANLDLGHGPWRYVLNSARMHLWHHDRNTNPGGAKNFGIIFSAWDWIFGTAYLPGHPPPALGFPGDEQFPGNLFTQSLWPLQRLLRRETR
jgi:sterol desaturase/sphingolipid hydroxylase (fatty acid hydroxylase superfamily)